MWTHRTGLVLALFAACSSVRHAKARTPGRNRLRNDERRGRSSSLPRRKLEDVDVGPGNIAEMERLLLPLYERVFAEYRPDPGTPQYDALNFVIYNTFGQLSTLRRVQQYALAVFYYSTFAVSNTFVTEPAGWSTAENWLSFYECQWEGIECEPSGNIVGIFLPDHNVAGSLPIELAFLSSLEVMDLSSNQLHIPPNSVVLGYMTNLRTLLLNDNFFVTDAGLPSSFVFLSNLQEVDLSRNLLQGRLDDSLFGSLTSLRRLVLEANYLSGPLPSEQLGQLSSLEYLYLRKNLLDIDLNTIFQPSRFPSLFSFWIDDNQVGSTIPTMIGQFTTLASLSMANVGLEGSIPIEFAQLMGLRRVWLFKNNLAGSIPPEIAAPLLQVFEVHGNPLLSGTMPESICGAVAASDYESRSLTVDCDVVLCEDCCTTCYSSTSNITFNSSTSTPATEKDPTLVPTAAGSADPTTMSPSSSTLTTIVSSLEPSIGPDEEPTLSRPSSFGPATANYTMAPSSSISPTPRGSSSPSVPWWSNIVSSLEPSTGPSAEPTAVPPSSFGPAASNSTTTPSGDVSSSVPLSSSIPSQSASPTDQPRQSFNVATAGAPSAATGSYGTINWSSLFLHFLSVLATIDAAYGGF